MVREAQEKSPQSKERSLVLWFDQVGISDISLVGGKNASLGEMIQQLTPQGVNVPNGFATTAYAYRYFIEEAGLEKKLRSLFSDLNVEDVNNLRQRGKQARSLILQTPFSEELHQAIAQAYQQLCEIYGHDTDVAVRSSATAEDLPDASFAGQQETYLNIHSMAGVLEACHRCFASLFTDRAISYRHSRGFDNFSIALSVGVQKMVRSDLACSGVMFSIDTETGFQNAALITAAYGLGENVVQGAVNPDEYYVFKPTLKAGFNPILAKRLGTKEFKLIYDTGGSKLTKNIPVLASDRCKYALQDEEILQLGSWACRIEDHYSAVRGTYTPMDIEWAKDGLTGELFIVQARPETVQSQRSKNVLRSYHLKGDAEMLRATSVLVKGRSVGESIGQGKATVILDINKIDHFQPGEVLVTDKTDPDWEPILKKASAIVTNSGGRTCFDGDTKVLTNRGFLTLREIHRIGYEGLSTLSLNLQTHRIEWKPILDSMKKRSRQIAISVSQTGRIKDNILRLTPDHKMINIRDGKLVKTEIQEMLSRQEMLVIAQKIPNLETGDRYSEQMAYLLGGIMTDGSIYRNLTHGEVQFIQKDVPHEQAFINEMNECALTLYGKAFSPCLKPISSGYIRGDLVVGQATAYRLYSKQIADDLYDKQQDIVNILLNSSVTLSYYFLAGAIDGDGWFYNNRFNIYVSKELLLQAIVVACLKIGIVPQVTRNRTIYHVQIVEKLDNILEFTQRVRGIAKSRTIKTRFFATAQLFDEKVLGQLKLRKDKNLLISAEYLEKTGKFPELLAGDLRMQRVIPLEEEREDDVYNLTIANYHNYVVFTSKYTPVLVCNCHAAIIAREIGIPAIVGCGDATTILKSGQEVTISCAEGEEGRVYAGLLPFEVKEVAIENLPRTRTQILMNVGNPTEAFRLAAIPNNGVGLTRLEFIIANQIQVHPLALIHFDQLKDESAKAKIIALTALYEDKLQYFIDKLAQGVGMIAAAFYPRPVVVRMSDFKTNEYANLLGGKQFEPKEENPMLGWRGASRYYDDRYRDAFALECQALKRVRDQMGLTNVIPMIPFCRTPDEGRRVLAEMAKHGLKRGDDLQVYVMCELPSNVIMAEEFCEIFDGLSIGSNDLTQLTLGLDRDSSLVAHLFDERHESVKRLIKMAIASAKKHNRKIGICGQAPSDYPEFAQFLVEQGIDSISLNPDSVLKTLLIVAEAEQG